MDIKYQAKTVEQLEREGVLSSFAASGLPQEFKEAVILIFKTSSDLKKFFKFLFDLRRSIFDTMRGHIGYPTLAKWFAEYLGIVPIPNQKGEKWVFINGDDYKNILKPILDGLTAKTET